MKKQTTTISISSEVHKLVKSEAEALGMKLAVMIERILLKELKK
jgi:hypothetical protein